MSSPVNQNICSRDSLGLDISGDKNGSRSSDGGFPVGGPDKRTSRVVCSEGDQDVKITHSCRRHASLPRTESTLQSAISVAVRACGRANNYMGAWN